MAPTTCLRTTGLQFFLSCLTFCKTIFVEAANSAEHCGAGARESIRKSHGHLLPSYRGRTENEIQAPQTNQRPHVIQARHQPQASDLCRVRRRDPGAEQKEAQSRPPELRPSDTSRSTPDRHILANKTKKRRVMEVRLGSKHYSLGIYSLFRFSDDISIPLEAQKLYQAMLETFNYNIQVSTYLFRLRFDIRGKCQFLDILRMVRRWCMCHKVHSDYD